MCFCMQQSHVEYPRLVTVQVMKQQFELIKYVAASSGVVSKADAFVAIEGLVEKVADIKLKGTVFETLLVLCENVGPQFVFSQIHSKAEKHKNPKVGLLEGAATK